MLSVCIQGSYLAPGSHLWLVQQDRDLESTKPSGPEAVDCISHRPSALEELLVSRFTPHRAQGLFG